LTRGNKATISRLNRFAHGLHAYFATGAHPAFSTGGKLSLASQRDVAERSTR